MTTLHICLLFSSLLFCVGFAAALSRSSAILVLLGVELMLNAGNINFIAFWRFPVVPGGGGGGDAGAGVLFVLFSIAIAAAEAAVGLALIIAIHRSNQSIRLQDAATLKG